MHIPSPRSSRSHLEAFSSWRSALCPSPTSLRAYFTSGWAFFIPYLLIYLLYYWRKWPANSSAPSALGHGGYIPALLHVYWALHVINAILAVIALRSWWCEAKQRAISGRRSADSSDISANSAINRPPATGTAFSFQPSAFSAALRAVAPWLFLTLIFAIPSIYLEWPSDPWEHLRRITEWKIHPLIGSHSAGYKSFYFFAYSWVGWLAPTHLLSWLNVYYTSVCLLLAWQYYGLAKAVGLDRRWAFLFVIVNVLTFGNVCFSFYRYYGLSTSIYAQLGAVALTRIVLKWAKGKGGRAKRETVTTTSEEQRAEGGKPLRPWRLPLTALPAAIGRFALCALLLAFIGFNHVQGIGIAGLSVAAICIWRLVEWKRPALWWLLGIALALSVATILWYPRNPIIDSVFRPGGWLNVWYGFDLFSPGSSASDRMIQIIGITGSINLFVGAVLLRRNHLVGWLTLTPIFALSLPFIAIPFAESISVEIIAYHRMFFAVPPNLAIVLIVQRYCAYMHRNRPSPTHLNESLTRQLPSIAIGICLCSLVLIPTIGPWFSRTWQALAIAPTDLTLQTVVDAAERSAFLAKHGNPPLLVSTEAVANIFNTVDPTHFSYVDRRSRIGEPITQSLTHAVATVFSSGDFSNRASLTTDPFATGISHWYSSYGIAPELVTNVSDLKGITSALQSRRGQRADVFTSELIPIEPRQIYRAQLTIIRRSGKDAIAYLALAWYDEERRLLESNVPSPAGAGNPSGWINGTYSYFGPIDGNIPARWTTYRRTFGGGKTAVIPVNAKYMRIGALLNYGYSPDGIVQLTNVKIWREKKPQPSIDVALATGERLLVVAPKACTVWTFSSQAALASAHWPANQVASDLGGGVQLKAAAHVANANYIGSLEMIIDPKE